MTRLGIAVVIFGIVAVATGARAQSAKDAKPTTNEYFMSVKKPLGEAGTRGQGVFLQRCQICHLPQVPEWGAPSGPVLSDFRLTTPDGEARFREKVLKGGFRMPAFQYGLTSQQVDDLVAYFKARS